MSLNEFVNFLGPRFEYRWDPFSHNGKFYAIARGDEAGDVQGADALLHAYFQGQNCPDFHAPPCYF